MPSSETVFLTGYPGFIGGRLLRRLAKEPFTFLLLVQSSLVAHAKDELREIAAQANRSEGDFQILEGDITEKNLGLSPQDFELARRKTEFIYHLAALYDLGVAKEVAMKVNVEGTQNVNAFAQAVENLNHYHYVSTCYVAGRRQGLILENELEHTAGFRNHYEETKYLAELEVENLKPLLPITIHRPSVVCGDSRTGETAKYDGIYYLIRYLLRWPRVLSLLNIGNSDVSLNLVPVDFIVDALAALVKESRATGKTLQLADPYPLTTRELFDVISTSIIGRGSSFSLPAGLVQGSLMFPPSPSITQLPLAAVPYFFLRQTYDTIESSRLLADHDVHCPSFRSYVDTIVKFAAAHPALS